MPSDSSEARKQAERLFGEFMDRVDRGEQADFEALCAGESAEVERHLRRLLRERHDVSQILGGAWATLSAVQRLQSAAGKDVDPGISLEPEEGRGDKGSSSTLLERLAAHAPPQSRFRLKGEIGRGGMGVVIRTWDEDLRRHVALKVVLGSARAESTGDTPQLDALTLGRFLEEAQVTGQLDHPGIVPVHELGLDAKGQVYFAMRLVKGQTLEQVLQKVQDGHEGWSPTRTLGVILRACEAVAFAHSKNVVHRDLKPDNIMVGRFGEVYVMDWGLARVLGRKDTRDLRLKEPPPTTSTAVTPDARAGTPSRPDEPLVTRDGQAMGTPAYMPPEQAQGRVEEIGPPSDVYSMGAILYHLLAGQKPYMPPGARLAPREVAAMVALGAPEPVARLNPTAPAELVSICEKAMAREMAARYRTTLDLARDLRAYLENRVVSAYESGPIAELRKWVKRNKALAATAGAAFLAALVLAGWALVERGTARAEAGRADQNATLAERRATEAEAERARVLRLSDMKTLADLKTRVDALWPAHPDKIEAMETWLAEARKLAARAPAHEATLAELRSRGTPQPHPREAELAELKTEAAGLAEKLESTEDQEERQAIEKALAENPSRMAALEAQIKRERPHAFTDATDSWWHDTLVELVSGLTSFQADDRYGETIRSVENRLAFARTIQQRSIDEVRAAWDEAIASIANPEECPQYHGLVIKPQVGLVPIGRHPDSGLWEFWHVQTGEKPERDYAGKLVLTEDIGLVLVLIPGGTFWMGAQAKDPQGRNYDPQATDDESEKNGQPVEVALDAFFLSKYEMTQGQWQLFSGGNPSNYWPGTGFGGKTTTVLHPVEQVSWEDCTEMLGRLGLVLPTEAQWEYGCRAGTDTPWWTGRDKLDLDEAGNLCERFCKENGGPAVWAYEEELNDGYTAHGPVGSFRANPFGLHDVIGNVWEWCRDGYGSYDLPVMQGDGERRVQGALDRVYRGGGFSYTRARARSAYRNYVTPGDRGHDLGCRPARVISW